ncbi:DinB family protein [Fulvivirga lutea]|uniref:DinB family protein n=1 Tax=Fulvivirga lutea TaxID=2810512 RepID=A0A975A1Q6_9BACT|nr:DinB family protein [Fulvivirga lutea]QSE98679.1 DinB family protein [Fulvivirga lutea]
MLHYTKEDLIQEFKQRHLDFFQYLNSLTNEEFAIGRNTKWSAAQELDHILKSIKPLSSILPNKKLIINKFGKGRGISSDYYTLTNRYKTKLSEGYKAFGNFLPVKVNGYERANLLNQFFQITNKIENTLEQYSEEELNTLRIPHPLLGMLTIKEMMYFTNYHVLHHKNNIINNLNTN